MAFSQTDLDAVNKAIASGALTVEYGDKRITYRSMDDLLKAKSVISEELAAASGSASSDACFGVFYRQ